MARLVAVDLAVGRIVRIDGLRYRVVGFGDRRAAAPTVLLSPEASARVVRMPRAELYALIVEEKAEIVDETEDPERVGEMTEINLERLSDDRLIDWYHKMILLRHLFPHAASSPRSRLFRKACAEAREVLQWVREDSAVMSYKNWSDKTLNDDLRRWRRAGYALSALQVKGLQYRPWRTRRPKYTRLAKIVSAVRRQNPMISIANVARQARFRFKRLQEASGQGGLAEDTSDLERGPS